MKEIARRTFLKGSIAAGAGMLLPHSRVLGANEDIRMGVIGLGGNGRGHVNRYRGMPGVRLVAICDADKNRLNAVAKRITDDKGRVETYVDLRRMLDNKDIDAVTISTPNHWHALAAIWACQAGKDVKVEKPVSHNIWEGRKIVEAARKYGRIVQAGSESRSDPALKEVFEYIQQGGLGKILLARGFCYKLRSGIGKVAGPQAVPGHIDYNLWTGPAPLKPLMRKKLHYDWHWMWDTGNGDICNQGAHEMDMCRWALGQKGLPPRVMSIGGRFGFNDDGETANSQIALLDYEPAPIIFEVRHLPNKKGIRSSDHYKGIRIGVIIECEGGYFAGGVGGGCIYDNDGKRIKQFTSSGGGGHSQNFINAIRSRKVSDLNADIEVGHTSAALSHMANISHRIGTRMGDEDIKEIIKSNPKMAEAFERFEKHLRANEVDTQKTPAVLGPMLQMDPVKERFHGKFPAKWANQLLTREYRKPFAVPQEV
jgi:predicted dehydrogenase